MISENNMDIDKNEILNSVNKAYNSFMEFTTKTKKDGVIRYSFTRVSVGARKDIEEKGLIILDEGKNWIDVISPTILSDNIKNSSKDWQEIAVESWYKKGKEEIVNKILNLLTNEVKKEEKLKDKYHKWKSYMKSSPWSVNEEHLPAYEEWLKTNGNNKII